MSLRHVVILALALALPGCSLLFVDGPPQVRPGAEAPPLSSCTSEMILPNLDLIFGALNGIGGAALLAGGDDDLTDEESSQLGIWSIGWGAILLVSEVSGRRKVNSCRDFLATPVQAAGPPAPRHLLLPDTKTPVWRPETSWAPAAAGDTRDDPLIDGRRLKRTGR